MPKFPAASDSYPVVLAVTPDPNDPEVLESTLKNWSVRCARTCTEALDFLRESECNVVVCEKELPDGGWHDLVAGISQLKTSPPVVVMSGGADEIMWAEVLRNGGFDLISKPLESREVRRIMPSAEMHSSRRRLAANA
jgi:DNA-binding NtrC family response regulator